MIKINKQCLYLFGIFLLISIIILLFWIKRSPFNIINTNYYKAFHSKCVCILTRKPHPIMLNFLYQLKETNKYDIYLLCDDNSKIYKDDIINIIQVDTKECVKNNYKSITGIAGKKQAIAYDKAMYYFCNHNIYKYYWFIEDDVFIPTIDTINNIDNIYSTEDILSATNNKTEKNDLNKWLWNDIKRKHNNQFYFDLPFYQTMACAIRLSDRMLYSIKEFVLKYKTLTHLEYFFNTLGMKEGYDVRAIPELSTIVYRHSWEKEDIKTTNLYHPIKNLNKQQILRNYLKF